MITSSSTTFNLFRDDRRLDYYVTLVTQPLPVACGEGFFVVEDQVNNTLYNYCCYNILLHF
jgi:hypothetical protein